MPEFLLVLSPPFPPAEFKLLLPLLLLYTHLTASFSRTNRVSRYHKGKTSLDLNEAKDHGVLRCSGISWIICKQSAYCSRQITTTTHHRSISTDRMLFLAPNQQRQSTEDITRKSQCKTYSAKIKRQMISAIAGICKNGVERRCQSSYWCYLHHFHPPSSITTLHPFNGIFFQDKQGKPVP